jgi:hypothetical protein
MKVKLPKFECLRCGHKWNPRSEEVPLRCAFCKSPYWNKATLNGASVPEHKHEQECMGCREKR